MLFVRITPVRVTNIRHSFVRSDIRKLSVPATSQNEVVEEVSPAYPEIRDLSAEARHRRTRETFANNIKKLQTVEEKALKINMPRYYGWRLTMIKEGSIPYNTTSQIQFYTRTHIPEKPGLPSYYDNIMKPEQLGAIVEKLKPSIEEALIFEYANRNRLEELNKEILEEPKQLKNIVSQAVSKQVHRSLMNHLGLEKPHLLETEIDHEPRIEAFWFVGGIPSPPMIKYILRGGRVPESIVERPVDRAMQYLGTPNFQLRHRLPLPPIVPVEECENTEMEVPEFKYEPGCNGFKLERRHGTNIPGFWPGDTNEFGVLSYHSSGHLASRRKEFNDKLDALKVQAMLGSWGWLLSQACNLGFSTFNDVTYPLTHQMIITNGKWWTFCAYQLNTTTLYGPHIDDNPRRNICWMSEPMKLFEKIEDGKVHGLNTEVLEHLVKFYANEPRERDGVDLKPYLHPGIQRVANYRGPEKRAWLEQAFKHVVSNRPRHRRLPEIYDWQKIYLRTHKTRPMDKKREPWEFGINQWHRKLDAHHPKYIPKALRSEKAKNTKWERTYWPR